MDIELSVIQIATEIIANAMPDMPKSGQWIWEDPK